MTPDTALDLVSLGEPLYDVIRDVIGRGAFIMQKNSQAFNEAVQVRDVGQDVVGMDDVGSHSLVLEVLG